MYDFFKPVIDGIAWILEFLGGLIVGIGTFIWDLFKAAIEGIVSGVTTIVGWIGDFFKFLGDLLHDFFVPDDDFFDKKIKGLQNTVNSKINTDDLKNALDGMKGVNARSIPTPRSSNFMGLNINIDVMSSIYEHLDMIHMFIRAIAFVLLIRYNINNVYKLIRGSDLNSGGDD